MSPLIDGDPRDSAASTNGAIVAQHTITEPGQLITWPQLTSHRVVHLEGLNVSLSTEDIWRAADKCLPAVAEVTKTFDAITSCSTLSASSATSEFSSVGGSACH